MNDCMTAPSSVQVQDFMTHKPIHINETDTLSFVMNMFERTHISGAPVVNIKGDYVGVVSKTDLASTRLLRHLHQLDKTTAREFMRPEKPITIRKDAPLEQAVDLMLANHIHRVFVDDESGKIIGVLSSFDIMQAIKRTDDVSVQSLDESEPDRSEAISDEAFSEERHTGNGTSAKAKAGKSKTAAADADPSDAGGKNKAGAAKTEKKVEKMSKADKEREIERRIFSLVTRKQNEIMRSR